MNKYFIFISVANINLLVPFIRLFISTECCSQLRLVSEKWFFCQADSPYTGCTACPGCLWSVVESVLWDAHLGHFVKCMWAVFLKVIFRWGFMYCTCKRRCFLLLSLHKINSYNDLFKRIGQYLKYIFHFISIIL